MSGEARAPAFEIRDRALFIRVRVKPKGGRDAIMGARAQGDGTLALIVKVRAAPEDGAANAAVAALLAKALAVPKRAVTLASGPTSRQKVFRIDGESAALAARAEDLMQTLEAQP